MTPEYYDMLVRHCGAVAVSMYSYDECVTALKELRQRGLTQTNIHMVAAEESYRDCVALLKRLNQTGDKQHVNAVVFLCLKPVGRGQNKTPMSKAHFNELVELSFDFGINIGFDSCSAPLVYDCYPAPMQQMIEPCESGCFSVYVNVRGEVFPCSFTEQSAAYEGIPITDDTDFLDDIWFSETFNTFRNTLLDNKDCNGCRRCPAFNLYGDEVN